jgi:DNA-binding transcriptional LysR family regulator
MDLDLLRCFDAAATTLNFRSAAERTHLSPPAFSDSIRRLEQQLGAPLFVRSTREVALSDAGRQLLPMARQLLADVEKLFQVARAPGERGRYELILGTRYELGLSWLCPLLDSLERNHPERAIHLRTGDSPELLAHVERGEIDAVIGSMRLTSAKLSYATLHEEQYVLVARKPCLKRADDATAITLVDVSRDLPLFRYFLDALPDQNPWQFARVELMGGIGNIRRRLLDGDNRVAVLPRYFVRDDLAAGRLVRLFRRVPLRTDAFRLIWRTGHARASELLALADELRALPLR